MNPLENGPGVQQTQETQNQNETQKQGFKSPSHLSTPTIDKLKKENSDFSNFGKTEIGKQIDKKEGSPESKKLEGLKLADGKEITKENYKDLKASDVLKMKDINRLNLLAKGDKNLERKDLQKGKEIVVDYSKFGDENKDLYLNTSAGEILPIEVGSVMSDGKEYTRNDSINGEFVDKDGNRLIIKDGTKLEINSTRTDDDFKKLGDDFLKNKKEFLEKNKMDKKDPNYKENLELIEQGLLKGLNGKEINYILEGKYDELAKITPESKRKEVFKNLQTFKESGLVDGYVGGNVSIDKPDLSNLEFPGVSIEDQKKLKLFIDKAVGELGNDENSGKADKYLKDFGNLSSRTTPWCAAFVSWTLKEASFNGKGSLSSKSFIGEGGKGHIGIKVGDKLLAGNQGNTVSTKPLNPGAIKGYVLPTDLSKHYKKGPFTEDNIPDGAIIVYDRGKGTT